VSLGRNGLRKPEWLKVRLPHSREYNRVKRILSSYNLHSICQEALCPNMTECFHSGTATFLILGTTCTRNCKYCNVHSGRPLTVDEEEPARLAQAVRELGLRYVVITSVTRDDLHDGGADIFARCVRLLRRDNPGCKIEVLIPDFRGDREALDRVIEVEPDVINHNIEVVQSLFRKIRPHGSYQGSLDLLGRLHRREKPIISKSGFMVGLGERQEEIFDLLEDLAAVHCGRVTIGQYQQPTRAHWPVHKYYHPDEFAEFKRRALQMGFTAVESGPLVRSSYHAAGM